METLNTGICELDHYDCLCGCNFRKLLQKMCSVRNVLKEIKIYYIKISVYDNKDVYAKKFFLSVKYPQKY